MRLTSLIATTLVVSISAAACSSGGDAIEEQNATSTTSEPIATSTSTTAPPSTTTPTTDVDPEAALAAWLSVWDGAEFLITDPSAAEQEILAASNPAVYEQLNTIYKPEVSSDAANSPRLFEHNPVAVIQDDGTVVVNDCMFETPKAGNATIWYSGVAEQDDGVWRISTVQLESEIGCVPASIAGDAIAGYEAYWDARVEFWDPADPENPLVGLTMTGAHLELLKGLLTDHASRGLALRGRAITHPEIIEVRSDTEVAILDCSDQDTGRGLFVMDTGERLDDVPVVGDGQRDLTSAVMVKEDGVWKVSDIQGQADVSCDTAPTSQGLPVV